ncbi:MAG: aminomethyl-transferring glycine dehydrogenase subunit GcvPA [Chloroflexi bacterium]|nr:aminomethyl-transferring glycine dehydrogenase subunit GcvPA [Chloroflexota bacterium]
MVHTVDRPAGGRIAGGNPHPYIPATDADRAAMLAAIGVSSFEDLVQDIPEHLRFPELTIAESAPELSLSAELAAMAARNVTPGDYACFLGAGAYRHFIPSTVGAILQRGEFVTAYTPYQPEAAQGTLQTGFEFQSAICQLFDMEVANAGMYDGPTAFAEAALMACRLTRRNKVAILETADDRLTAVLRAYSAHQQIEIISIPADGANTPDDIACVAFQSPNLFGVIEDVASLTEKAHAAGALSIAHVNPTAHGLFQPPGKYGVDIVTAEGQPLGVPLSFGGAYVGLFACRQEHIRQLPGRIIGRTTDTQGRTGYVLTLQTREQHIRRERATSNICTSTQLIGLMVAVYVATLGKQGMRDVANLCYQKAHYAASEIAKVPGYSLPVVGAFFHEFAVTCPRSVAETNAALLKRKIIGGYDISDRIPDTMLICVTEMNSRGEIDTLISALREIGGAQ